MQAAVAWIGTATRPKDEGGLGMELFKAIETAAHYFELTEDTLKHYWDNHSEFRRGFPRPISTLPDR